MRADMGGRQVPAPHLFASQHINKLSLSHSLARSLALDSSLPPLFVVEASIESLGYGRIGCVHDVSNSGQMHGDSKVQAGCLSNSQQAVSARD